MAPQVYTSPVPDYPVLTTSVFTRVFSSRAPGDVGGFPGSQKAFVDASSGASITRAQLLHLSLSFAHGLKYHPRTSPFANRGNVVLIYSPNSLAWPVVLFGSVAAGLRCALANSAYTSDELAFQYSDSRANLILTSEEGLDVVRATFAKIGVAKEDADRRIIVLGNDLRWAGGPSAAPCSAAAGLLKMEDLLGAGKLDHEESFEGHLAHETTYLCYSSGTTGKPKGVETTHQNMTTILDIMGAAFPPVRTGLDMMLGILPFYHIFGVSKLLHFPFVLGIPVVIQRRFDPIQFCAVIEKYRVTMSMVVPPILVVLARHPAVDHYDMSSLEILFCGAAPLGHTLAKSVKTRLLAKRGGRGVFDITQGYGLTETSPSTHMLPLADAARKMGSIGILLPNLQARLVEDDDGNLDAGPGQPGELWVRGKTVMKGYLNNSAATKHAITPEGWFRTGDVAVRDAEGYYYIVDRRKELIKYKGFQVPPAELENVLLTHPDVADAAVIGVDNVEEATELPRAYIVHVNPSVVQTAKARADFGNSVAKWMTTKVARHKYLRGGVEIIDVVPKSASGKILRRELRELAKRQLKQSYPTMQVEARL
ncbi:AMP binding protein [Mycena belliarum]|uniref:AMP binding protein n=1 Tax=Mycena belliarum TaxID=1033014 RepID=A0AAD6XNH5_9AGAR|nr:AMP binding protein [Mycena belliae]